MKLYIKSIARWNDMTSNPLALNRNAFVETSSSFHPHSLEKSVFQVRDPPCPVCESELDFTIVENVQNTGMDIIRWWCKNTCGYSIDVEIL